MSILGLGTDYQQLIKGLVLLLAVGFDIFNKNRGGGGGASLGKRFKLQTTPPATEPAKPAEERPVAAGIQRTSTVQNP
jgi:putative multiple sugar transport system permease protein